MELWVLDFFKWPLTFGMAVLGVVFCNAIIDLGWKLRGTFKKLKSKKQSQFSHYDYEDYME